MSRDLILLSISMMAWGVGEGMFFIFLPLYLQQLGAVPVAIGLILSAAGIMMTVAHIPAGHLSDRIGRKPLLLVAWITATVAAFVMALAPALPLFVFGFLLYNLTAFVSSPLNSYVTAARNKLTVTRAITMVSAIYNSGVFIGSFLGGQVGQRFGLQTSYFISGGIFFISLIILLFIKSQAVEKHDPQQEGNNKFVDLRFIKFLSVIFLAGFSMYLAQPLSSNYLQNQKGLSLESIGVLGSISSLGIVILNLVIGNINPYIGYILVQLSVATYALILWRATGFAWLCVGYFLMSGYRTSLVLATALTKNLVHQSRMGLAYGMTATISSSSAILAPALAGILYQIQPPLMYIVAFCMIIVSMLLSTRFIPKPVTTG
jgi:MFS family permease